MERMWVSGVAWGGGSYKALGSFGAVVGAAVVFALTVLVQYELGTEALGS